MTSANLPILVLAPARDAELVCRLLGAAGESCTPCASGSELVARLGAEVGALVVAEEALSPALMAGLAAAIDAQPPWSDLPVLIVAQSEPQVGRLRALRALGNVSVIVRPMAIEALASATASALRARRRQYQVRDLLAAEREQLRRRDEFLAMLAHELRNPLAPIRYAASVLKVDDLPDDKRTMAAALIDRQVGHMARIVDDLLDVSRVTRGRIRLARTTLDAAAIVRESVEGAEPLAASRGLQLTFDESPRVWVCADPTRLKQIVDNLIDNAVKFCSECGHVAVSIDRQGEHAVIVVRDDGAGIDATMLSSIFEPFVQADRSLARSQGGLGLGLALARGLARLHGGDVVAHSDGPGRGSAFTVTMPACEAPAVAQRSEERAGRDAGMRILVIEDNVDAAQSLRLLLELSGHAVAVAHRGADGIATARWFQPDAVLCDIGLPDMSGYDVARALRDGEPSRSLPLIAVTGYATTDDRDAALAAGFDDHLRKPVDADDLRDVLRQRRSDGARSAAGPRTGPARQ
jgi:signal transduction histidine kinase/ActR/RegA family two-component response regulator